MRIKAKEPAQSWWLRRHVFQLRSYKFRIALFMVVLVLWIIIQQQWIIIQSAPTSKTVKEEQEVKGNYVHPHATENIIPSSADDGLITSDYNGSFVRPAWRCSSSNPSPSPIDKLFFVHVFKTAGSTFRVFFDNYGKKCGKGVSTIIRCSNVDAVSLNSHNPDRDWTPTCGFEKTITRVQNYTTHVNDKVSRSRLQNYTDIAIGHYSVGIHKNWIDSKSKEPIAPQYLAFFREPYIKYVSGTLFHNKKKRWSFEKAVEAMKSEIREYNSKGEQYNQYSRYLLTPEQKDYGVEQKHLSTSTGKHEAVDKEMVQVLKKNLIDLHMVVGIVEHMSDSLELIQSIIDVGRDLTDDFKSILKPPSSSGSLVVNKSKLSSSEIVQALKEDDEIWTMLTEMLKHEFEIYAFASKLHKIQVKEMRKKHGDRYSLFTNSTVGNK